MPNKNLVELVANHNDRDNRRNLVVLEGSTRSGKTISALQYLVGCCQNEPGVVARVVRKDGATCGKTVIPDLRMVLSWQDSWEGVVENKTEKTFSFDNGSVLAFDGVEDLLKQHGKAQDYLFVNEAMEVAFDPYKQLALRTRRLQMFDFNPSLSHHWIFDRILKRGPSEVLHIHSTFRDNPHLSSQQVEEILSMEPTPANIARGTADRYLWEVYGLGKRGTREGVIFDNWETTEYWPERKACERWGYGLDFGFSMDPSVLVECALNQDDLYTRTLFYEPGLIVNRVPSQPNTPSIEMRLEQCGINKRDPIFADNARPEAIAGLVTAGYNVIPSRKGPGSVVHGIDLLRARRWFVAINDMDLQRELENYTWEKTRAGVWLPEPVDEFNHAIDGIRYWAESNLLPRRSFQQQPKAAQAKTVLQGGRW